MKSHPDSIRRGLKLMLMIWFPMMTSCKKLSPGGAAKPFVKTRIAEPDMDPAALQAYHVTTTIPAEWRIAVYQKKKFHDMEDGAAKLLKEKSRPSFDRLDSFYENLGQIGADVGPALQKNVLDDWVKTSPQSSAPRLIRGIYEKNWAWIARGGGWAKDIPADAGRLFRERLDLAQDDLDKAAALEPDDPDVWSQLITVGRDRSLPRQTIETYFQKAITLDPGSMSAYRNKLNYLLPQWFGSEKEMLDFGEEARHHMDINTHLGAVWVGAYVYQAWFPQNGKVLLRTPDVWDPIHEWYERALKQEDTLLLRENYALVASLALQEATALEQYEVIGDRWTEGSRWTDLRSYNSARVRAYTAKAKEAERLHNASETEMWYRKAIDLGDSHAMEHFGWILSEGIDRPKDPAQAIALTKRAAALHNAYAINDLGVAYDRGEAVPKDDVQSVQFYRRAADMGLDMAQNNVGWMYHEGLGVPQDYVQALKWYQLSADQGYSKAIANIGWMYENGQGVARDLEKAKKYYRLAAAGGSAWAVERLTALSDPHS